VRTASLTILALSIAGCASGTVSGTQQPSSASVLASDHPLANLANRDIIVLPIQYLRFADSLGWSRLAPKPAEYLAAVDDEIAFALRERGLDEHWVFAKEISRLASNNSTIVADPHKLSAEELRGPVKLEQSLSTPLQSQIRTILALREGRFVILPIDLRFESANGTGVALLRLVAIDARFAAIKWIGEVKTDRSRTFSPALAASLASRFADLVAPIPPANP